MNACTLGFRIVGNVAEPRRLVDAVAALAGYASCDRKAEVEREAYLSAFQFPADVRRYIDSKGNGSVKGYAGPCWAPWLWFDIDRDGDLEAALTDARRLATRLDESYVLGDDTLLLFLSGGKGFHVGLPTALWSPEPSPLFHRVCRRFGETVAGTAGILIDAGVYDAVRPFRAPNSRHPKTGLHKRRFSFDELLGLSLQRIVELAREPAPFDLPAPLAHAETAALLAADWQSAVKQVAHQGEVKAARRAAGNAGPTLNRSTLAFIRDGADNGDRHRLLLSAAANLAEFSCPPALAHALLSESALDAGLPPRDVRRQIDCGLSMTKPQAEGAAPHTVEPTDPPAIEAHNRAALSEPLRALWGSKTPTPATPSVAVPPHQTKPSPAVAASCNSHLDPADWLDAAGRGPARLDSLDVLPLWRVHRLSTP